LALNLACGLKDGLVAEKNGMLLLALLDITKVSLKQTSSSTVLIMVSKTQTHSIQMASAVDHLSTKSQLRREKKEMTSHVTITQAFSKLRIEDQEKVLGHAVKQRLEKLLLVLRTSINFLNGQMKKQRSISLISL
jgi:hypothetical protein